ncbi:hypothetical protein [Lapillicoccus jejuensis]|uniref:LPXTG-motif cell wall-anchored protein n=1 Tax=Lapillicoccus jejuensis TaxID=402171 RepID=A0A542E4I8_9MICO|nr:hypothetical protein [Lapillicoccus jejuensis]TQJ10237.1 LPXTG-motif cell wall-anchored protein [Lapillicoccus jejuensis]
MTALTPRPRPRALGAARRAVRTSPDRVARLLRAALATVCLATSSVGLVAAPADAVAAACNGSNGVTVTSLNAPRFYIDSGVTPKLTSGYAGYDVSATAARHDLYVQLSGFTGGSIALAASQPTSMPLGATAAGAHTPAFFLLDASAASLTAQTHTVQVWSGKPGAAGSSLLCATSGGFGGVDETIKAAANKVQDTTGDGVAVTLSTATPRLGGSISVSVEGSTGTVGSGTTADPNGLYMTPTALPSWPAGAFRLTGTSLLISPDGSAPAQTYTNLLHLGSLGSSSRSYVATYTFTITGTTSTGSQLYPLQQIASGTQIKHTDTGSFSTLIPAIPAATNPLTVALSASPTTLPAAGGTSRFSLQLRSTASTASIADQLQAQLPSGASYVAGSTTIGGVSAPDPASSAGLLSWTGPFTTSSSAPTDLRFDVSLPSGAATYPVSGWGLLGSTVLDTTADTSDTAAASVTLTVPATDAQTIAFPTLADTVVTGAAPTLSATASSGLPVTYAVSTPAVCTVSGGVLTLVSVGTCTVTASQAGNASWAAATPVSRSFAVTEVPSTPSPQSISFPALTDTVVTGAAPTLSATASSGLPVSYAVSTPAVCTVSGGVLTLVSPGTCTVTATQPGDATYAAATPVDRSFDVTAPPLLPVPQTITFPVLADTALDATAPALGATATSGLPVAYATSTPTVCTVSGGVLTLVSVGTCSVTASQPGSASWLPAAPVTRDLAVLPVPQTITFPTLPATVLGDPAPGLSATASSSLPVTYTSTTPTVCTVTDGALTLVSVGTCTVTATQTGDATYDAATPVDRSFAVTAPPALPSPQTITFPALADVLRDGTAPALAATSDSGLPVAYATTTPAVCTVSDGVLTLVSVGTCSVTASQPGSASWLPATPRTRSFSVLAVPQSITFPVLTDTVLGAPAPTLSATASSHLPVGYASTTPLVCSVSGGVVTLVSVGTCSVTATQPGDATYAAATPIGRSFVVGTAPVVPSPQTITFPALPDTVLGHPAPALSATASSGLAVTYTSSTPTVCTVTQVGGLVDLALRAAGPCSLTATQPGDSHWSAATPVVRTFTVTRAAQTVTFPDLPDTVLDATPPAPVAAASSGLPVVVTSITPAVCTVTDGRLVLLAVGTCRLVATQAGDATYAPAAPVTRTLTVLPPAAPPYRTSGVGTAIQSTSLQVPAGFTVALLDGDRAVTTLTVPGQGTYTLVGPSASTTPPTGLAALLAGPATRAATASGPTVDRIDFAPVLGFVGVARPATYRLTDPMGQTATATYTPTVTVPAAPPSAPKATRSHDSSTQTTTIPVPPGGTVTLLDHGRPVRSLTIPGEGTYTVDPATGRLTFTPVAGFTGSARPVDYRVTDAYGQSTTSTYRATVVPSAAPAPTPAPVRRPAPVPVHAPAHGLPHTGADLAPLLALAAGLVLLGSTLTVVARRRR